MIQLGITDFLLDLILDWDDIEDYTMYVPEGPEYEKYDRDAIQPVVVVSPQPSHEDTVEESWKDRTRFPIFRGGVTVREAEERLDRFDAGLKEITEGLIWIGEQSGEPAW